MRRTKIRCRCGGEYVVDTVTVEAGGYSVTEDWGLLHCDTCGACGDEPVAEGVLAEGVGT